MARVRVVSGGGDTVAAAPESLAASAPFVDGGEVGADLAKVDWASTPLGVPADWPQSLRTTVHTLLASRFSMWMAWGPDLTFFCNAAYRRDTLGRKYPWALGRPASEVWEEIWPDIGPRIERVLSTGEATWDEALLLFLERSGYTEETYHTFSYSPLRDDDGAVVGMLCVVTEDTARVIAERRMATLRDLGSDPTVVQTEEEMLAFTSRQLGRNPKDLPFTLTYLFDDCGIARLSASSGLPAGHPAAPAELSADGTAIWPVRDAAAGRSTIVDLDEATFSALPSGAWPEPPVQAVVTPLIAQGGMPTGFLVTGLNRYRPMNEAYRGFLQLVAAHIASGIASARTYAAQQHRAEQLAELDRAKTMFFSNISHEFRTPLTLILGPIAELLSDAGTLDDRVRAELEVVQRNGLRLSKLVNSLLDFSRIEAGRVQPHYQPVDLAALTAELAGVFSSATQRAGLDLRIDCPPLQPPAYVDRDMWEKVIFNLFSNALKFTIQGTITAAVRRDGNTALVTVSDTGIGIPAAEMPRLFERFHRIPTNSARSAEGSGIGLALAKELVGLQGGTIAADSVAGAGTTFTIRLPLGAGHLPADADIGPAAEPDSERGAARGQRGQTYTEEALRWIPLQRKDAAPPGLSTARPATTRAKILVADDNADMREFLVRLLHGAGYQVTAVNDGHEALDAARADVPDLVISDVMMPHIDGLALVSALRADVHTALAPVVLLSARAGQEAPIEGLHAGADDYLVKPFSSGELLARVETNIALTRMRNRHARWRAAVVHSLQEAFFICDEDGTCIEVNDAFTDIVGYGPDGLPYTPPFPWWPDPATQADEFSQAVDGYTAALQQENVDTTFVMKHRDGHRVWVDISLDHAEDPVTGRLMMVGTFRDVTAEHYRQQREMALADLNGQLAQAENLPETVSAATLHLARVFDAPRALAATFRADATSAEPDLVNTADPVSWSELSTTTRQHITALAGSRDLLVPDTDIPGAAGIALPHPNGVLVMWLDLGDGRPPLSAEEQSLLTMLASRLNQGLQRVGRVDEQRRTALALQHAILGPANLPVGFAARYQPATRPLEVGGDWYDVVAIDESRIAMVVGDCVGHGLSAATVMGQLRSACRALLLQRLSPADTLDGLDRFAAGLAGASCTTACCAIIDTTTGELTYSSAGHPPPILAHPDGTITMLEDGRTIPLGIEVDRFRPTGRATVPAGATLLMYTDGLVERRGLTMDDGIGRVAALVSGGLGSALDELAACVLTAMQPQGGYHDDVAILAYRRIRPLELRFTAGPAQIAPARAALREWLAIAGAAPQLSTDVLLAVGEAVSNAVEHGHRAHPDGVITLCASVTGAKLEVDVTDTGQWKIPDPPNGLRGRGISLIRSLIDDVVVESGAHGTTVRLSVNLT
jgi:PAS domain S-box-containing protein